MAQANPDLNADLAMDRAADLRQTAVTKANEQFEAAARAAAQTRHGPFAAPPLKTAVDPGRHYLTFAMDLPVSYNTNPGSANGDASLRFDPKVQLNGGYQFAVALLSASVTADVDRYPGNPAQHGSNVIPNVSLEFNNPQRDPDDENKFKPQPIVPSLFYQSTLSAPSSTASFTSRIQDFGAAINGGAAIRRWRVGQEVGYAKRSTNTGLDSQAITIRPSFTYKFDKEWKAWSATFAPNLRLREFEPDSAGTRRRDTALTLPFKVVWSPESKGWKGSNKWDFVFFLNPTRNFSSAKGKDSRQTDTGVMAHYVYPFDKF